ncbi:MAG: hypothetical protein LAT58_14045, partial [Opitutales bacterium]|nr:hypothetical protein [Opitutales bacterium]
RLRDAVAEGIIGTLRCRNAFSDDQGQLLADRPRPQSKDGFAVEWKTISDQSDPILQLRRSDP